ncbi:inositol-pentakisphosphate 2-kinase-like isoform X1 [Leguminivora glycinivorella]|uniref:inositol-pentakisphosphate 2-kinase-like isoform X1 n=1 Tax=Leguminivora glycinivorella TaxID=1035111 RepID=UPI00200DE5D9|nr:inositol-pentakisphosphate 2-kinase-like isoform X1 [Leguminivora glycinivorella]
MSVLGKTWRYINEGNAHIVIGIQEERLCSAYVLRLIKEDEEAVDVNELRKSLDFVNFIMNPLLYNGSVCKLEIIELPTEELPGLINDLKPFRPTERLSKFCISPYSIKTRNLTVLNPDGVNYCVEIKPKEGFMAQCFRNYGKCYYCLKQYLKLRQNEILNISKYCPLDLFSGDRDRMKSALYHLSENPQNNFKIFKNGQIIYKMPNKDQFHEIIKKMHIFKSTSAFFSFTIETLLYKNKHTQIDNHSDDVTFIKENIHCHTTSNLNEGTLLYKIQRLQRLAEELTISTDNLEDKSLDYVSSLLEHIDPENSLHCATEQEKFLEKIEPLHKALISAVAKDCSIMIAFTPQLIVDYEYFIQVGENMIPFRASVADLEPKLPKVLRKREKMEKKLVEIYEEQLKNEGNSTPFGDQN